MKILTVASAAAALSLALTGCSTSSTDGAKETAKSAASSAVSSSSSTSSSSSSTAAAPFTMPNEVGKGLQTAQNDVQDASGNPMYISYSDDALGNGRNQVVDSNWRVCSQTPAAGKKVTESTQVRFKTVKLDEVCP